MLHYIIVALVHIALLMLHYLNVVLFCVAPFNVALNQYINIVLFYVALLMLGYINLAPFDVALFDAALFTIELLNVVLL